MRILIVGGGIYGLCAAWAMRRAGHEVVVFEQGTVGNAAGSSGDSHRLIRYAYAETPAYMRMVGEAYAAWQRLWGDLGVRLQIETGTLALGQRGTNWCASSQALLEGDGHAVEPLDRAALARRFPLIDPTGVEQAFYLPTGGALLADGSIERGDMVLVCAGPWVAGLAPDMAALVTPSRQVVVYLQPPADLADAWARHPMLLDIGDGIGFYLVPPVVAPDLPGIPGGGTGLKIGDHSFTLSGDPDRDRQALAGEADAILAQCASRLRDFARFGLGEIKTCFYTVEKREHFVARRLGGAGWVLSCCSGHGFKFASVIGEGFAAMLAGRRAEAEFAGWVGGETANPVLLPP